MPFADGGSADGGSADEEEDTAAVVTAGTARTASTTGTTGTTGTIGIAGSAARYVVPAYPAPTYATASPPMVPAYACPAVPSHMTGDARRCPMMMTKMPPHAAAPNVAPHAAPHAGAHAALRGGPASSCPFAKRVPHVLSSDDIMGGLDTLLMAVDVAWENRGGAPVPPPMPPMPPMPLMPPTLSSDDIMTPCMVGAMGAMGKLMGEAMVERMGGAPPRY